MTTFVTRREFLKAGIAGSALLACAGCVTATADEEAALLTAVSAAVLAGILPAEPVQRRAAVA